MVTVDSDWLIDTRDDSEPEELYMVDVSSRARVVGVIVKFNGYFMLSLTGGTNSDSSWKCSDENWQDITRTCFFFKLLAIIIIMYTYTIL